MSIKNASAFILQTVFGKGVHAVPTYQRDYSWGLKQCSQLWDDVLATAYPGGHPSPKDHKELHYLGAMVVVDFDPAMGCGQEEIRELNESVYHVVDGQQRLATLVLLLAALRSCLDEAEPAADPGDREKLRTSVAKLIESDDDASDGRPVLKVILNENDNAYFRDLVLSKGKLKTGATRNSHRKMKSAHGYFKTALAEAAADYVQKRHVVESHAQFYQQVLNAVRQRLEVTYIEVDTVQSAFQVFESLNAKGLSLSAADLVKNLLLQACRNDGIPVADAFRQWSAIEEELANGDVVTFLRHYLCSISGKSVRKADVYPTIRSMVKTEGSKQALDGLVKAAHIYGQLTRPAQRVAFEKSAHEAERSLAELRLLRYEQVYILLLAAAERWGLTKDLDRVVRKLIALAVRYSVCERNPNKLEVSFSRWAAELRSGSLDSEGLIARIAEEMPTDEEFKAAFQQLSVADTDARWGRYLLVKLEETVDAGSRKLVDLDDLTLEHIIPRSVDIQKWFGRELNVEDVREAVRNIGNLALLYAADNSSASNNSYSEKVAVYTAQQTDEQGKPKPTPVETFRLIATLVEQYPTKFDLDDVQTRAEYLANLAAATWR